MENYYTTYTSLNSIGRWLPVDPLAHKYPGWSPYSYCVNNPVIVVDRDGRAATTYTDEEGNVEKVELDGKKDLMRKKSDGSYEKAGETVSEYTFLDADNPVNADGSVNIINGAKVDYGSDKWREWIDKSLSRISGNVAGAVDYGWNARTGQPLDVKSQSPNPNSGSKVALGVYGTERDVGNILAGAVGYKIGLSLDNILMVYGAYNATGNSIVGMGMSVFGSLVMRQTPSSFIFGEAKVSRDAQVWGYQNVRTK